MAPNKDLFIQGFLLQHKPLIYLTAIPGRWLLEHTTTSWRIKNPEQGFQRIVRESRAREIALSVLDQHRSFPNAIVLATDRIQFNLLDTSLRIPDSTKFLVVDGQHRLWAQRFSEYSAIYGCMVHMGLSEVEMARLFIEINDNQKRVPSSLRWDLIRLVRPEDDPYAIGAAEMVYLLATERESPLFQRIDLTGEQSAISLKQGSLAPAIKRLIARRGPLHDLSFDQQHQVLTQYFIAIRESDRDSWGTDESTFYKARILRALLRLLEDLLSDLELEPQNVRYSNFLRYLNMIDKKSLDTDKIRASQGSAGIKAIYDELYHQVISMG